MNALLGALIAGVFAGALLLLVSGLRSTPDRTASPVGKLRARQRKLLAELAAPEGAGLAVRIDRRRRALRHTGGVVAALIVLLVTHWPVGALLGYAAVVFLPAMLGGAAESRRDAERLQALADWTRRLSTLLSASGGIEDALMVSDRNAPPAIAREVNLLATRLMARRDPAEALLLFADDIDDPIGDQIAAALTLAMVRRGRGLADALERLSTTVSEQIASRRKIEADRAVPRTTARNVTITNAIVISGIALLDRGFLRAYDTVAGQLVLVGVGAIYAGSFVWMKSLSTARPPARFLAADAGPKVLKPATIETPVPAATVVSTPAPVWNLAPSSVPPIVRAGL